MMNCRDCNLPAGEITNSGERASLPAADAVDKMFGGHGEAVKKSQIWGSGRPCPRPMQSTKCLAGTEKL